jgi:CTP:molybdopterin cytidylyltransferase MocA
MVSTSKVYNQIRDYFIIKMHKGDPPRVSKDEFRRVIGEFRGSNERTIAHWTKQLLRHGMEPNGNFAGGGYTLKKFTI